MKLKFTLLSAFIVFCFTFTTKAQQIPNGGFEAWSNGTNPDGFSDWESLNSAVPNLFTFKDTSRVQGQYSAQIVTDTVSFPQTPHITLAGVLAAGSASLGSAGQFQMSGIPFAFRPDTFFFSYKYTSPGTDTAVIGIQLSAGGTAILPLGTIALQLDSNWVSSYVVLTSHYLNGNTPDNLVLYFTSSGGHAPVQGSRLNIDNVGFGYNPSSGIASIKNQINLKVYPNPASTTLNIRADKDLAGNNVQLFDMNGQLVTNKVLDGNINTLNLSALSCGTYIYKITDKQNNVIDESKVSVIK